MKDILWKLMFFLLIGTVLTACGDKGGITNPLNAPLNAPSDISATGGNNQITIIWTGVTGATSYNIYWLTSSVVTKSTGTKISGVTSTPYIHSDLTNGTTYYYVITAVNSAEESGESNKASTTPSLIPPPPP